MYVASITEWKTDENFTVFLHAGLMLRCWLVVTLRSCNNIISSPITMRVLRRQSSRVSHQGLNTFSASVLSNKFFLTSPSKTVAIPRSELAGERMRTVDILNLSSTLCQEVGCGSPHPISVFFFTYRLFYSQSNESFVIIIVSWNTIIYALTGRRYRNL